MRVPLPAARDHCRPDANAGHGGRDAWRDAARRLEPVPQPRSTMVPASRCGLRKAGFATPPPAPSRLRARRSAPSRKASQSAAKPLMPFASLCGLMQHRGDCAPRCPASAADAAPARKARPLARSPAQRSHSQMTRDGAPSARRRRIARRNSSALPHPGTAFCGGAAGRRDNRQASSSPSPPRPPCHSPRNARREQRDRRRHILCPKSPGIELADEIDAARRARMRRSGRAERLRRLRRAVGTAVDKPQVPIEIAQAWRALRSECLEAPCGASTEPTARMRNAATSPPQEGSERRGLPDASAPCVGGDRGRRSQVRRR